MAISSTNTTTISSSLDSDINVVIEDGLAELRDDSRPMIDSMTLDAVRAVIEIMQAAEAEMKGHVRYAKGEANE